MSTDQAYRANAFPLYNPANEGGLAGRGDISGNAPDPDTSNGKLLAFYLVVNNVPAISVEDVLVVNNDLGKIAARLWGSQG